MSGYGVLRLDEAARIGQIIDACERNAFAGWLADGSMTTGIMRAISDAAGNLPGRDDDVRDLFVHITASNGTETFLPVSTTTALLATGHLILDFELPQGLVML